jgi:SAM-dependent methyltransferase
MTFDDLKNTWTALGEADPLWAILTNEESEGGGWDLDAFFASGKAEITSVMAEVDSLGLAFERARALDFGCGVGRLTRALGARFDEAHGVDIAPTMLDLGRRLNEGHPNLVFHLNQQPDLGLFPTNHFDFVYSRIVLQHMAPEYAARYIEEFVRVVRPGGLVAFQIPSRSGDDGAAVSDLLRPSGVFRAEVIVRAPLPELVAGDTHRIDVHVANTSSTTWAGADGSGPNPDLSVGNHWLDPGDNVVQMDDARAALPVRLAPGDTVVVPLTVRAPDVPGSYLLELDLVQEHVAWFRDKGSIPCAVPVTVVAAKPAPAWKRMRSEWGARRDRRRHETPASVVTAESEPTKPRFEMHGTAPAEILATVASAGGRVCAVQVDGSAARHWPSYFYFVTK